jgi:hypothetical protein
MLRRAQLVGCAFEGVVLPLILIPGLRRIETRVVTCTDTDKNVVIVDNKESISKSINLSSS